MVLSMTIRTILVVAVTIVAQILTDVVYINGQQVNDNTNSKNNNNNNNILGTGNSIPGTTQTDSGYDNEVGTDAICWRSQGRQVNMNSTTTLSSTPPPPKGINMSNPLVTNFILQENTGITLLRSCPIGNSLLAHEPMEYVRGERLRTKRWYNYTVVVTVNVRTLSNSTRRQQQQQQPMIISDQGPYMAIQVLVCQLGRSGFCSPFIHEASNLRLKGMNSTLPKPGPGESHGGTHVHSKYQFIHLDPTININGYHNVTVNVPMMINEPGQYFTIAAAQLYVGGTTIDAPVSSDGVQLLRYDMANAITNVDHRVFTYQSPATMLVLPNEVRIVSYLAIGIAGTIIIFMLYHTTMHRHHQVMRLTQGYFLILFLLAALVATIMCIFIEPRNDLFCQISLPSILISAQFMYAITLGRLWRINTLISPLLMKKLRFKSSWVRRLSETILQRIFIAPSSSDTASASINLRRKVHSSKLCIVIWLIASPQIIIQICATVFQTPYQNFEYNADESIGRAYCHRGDALATSLTLYAFICFGLLVLVLLLVANHTKSLPSLFNETNDIFSSTVTSLCIFVVGGGIVVSTNSPTTSPALQYVIGLALALSITLNTSIRIVMPKLRMIWSGEVVLVSKLVSDHSNKIRRRNSIHTSHGSNPENCDTFHSIDGGKRSESSEAHLAQYNNDGYYNQHHDSSVIPVLPETTSVIGTGEASHGDIVESSSSLPPQRKENVSFIQSHRVNSITSGSVRQFFTSRRNLCTSSTAPGCDDNIESQQRKAPIEDGTNIIPPSTNQSSDSDRFVHTSLIRRQGRSVNDPNIQNSNQSIRTSSNTTNNNMIHISNEVTPSRRLLLPLVEIQSTLQEMNTRIMSGLGVPTNEWMLLRQQSIELGQIFSHQVQFQWEHEQQAESQQLIYDIGNTHTTNGSGSTSSMSDRISSQESAPISSSIVRPISFVTLHENEEDDDDDDSCNFEHLPCNNNSILQQQRLEL